MHRYYDGAGEPCTMLGPIHGFNTKLLVTLEESVKPLIDIICDIEKKVIKAKRRAAEYVDPLSIDEAAAITLYTMEWHPYTNSLYYILNIALRTENREILKPWFLYFKLIFTALSRLPTVYPRVYRGVVLADHEKYKQNNDLIWWGFSSCSTNRDIAENEKFLGQNGRRTLFIIDCLKGKDISKYSYFRKESEVLLLPATNLEVIQCKEPVNNLYVIHLREIQSQHQLLESISTETSIPPPLTVSQPYVNSKLSADVARIKEHTHACLYRKQFTDNDIQTVVQEVIRKKQIRVLTLRGKEITFQGAIDVAKALENNSTLEGLYLTGIKIDDIGAQTLAESISCTNSVLKQLCLNHNGITDKGAEHLAIMLERNQSLTHLRLPNNCISDRGIQCLAKALTNNNRQTLQLLSLEWNKFENVETVNILGEMITKNETLLHVDIDGRGLSRSDVKKLKSIAKTKRGFKLKVH